MRRRIALTIGNCQILGMMLEKLMRGLGAPPGESEEFYRDAALGCVALPTGLIAAVLLAANTFNVTFWVCTTTYLLCIVLARTRSAILALPLLFAGVRLLFGFFVFRKVSLLAAGIACLAAVVALGWLAQRSRRRDPL